MLVPSSKVSLRTSAAMIAGMLSIVLLVSIAWSQHTGTAGIIILGNKSPALSRATLLGRQDPNAVMDIVVGLKLRNEKELEDLIARQSDPKSSDYHNFITPLGFTERFGPDLGLLAGLTAEGSLKPRVVEQGWRELSRIGPLLRDRQIPGKAVFNIEQR